MTPALVFAAAWCMTSILWAAALGANLDLRKTNRGLRDQLAAERSAAERWRRGVAAGYHDAPGTRTNGPNANGNVTPSFVGERPTLRASEPRWTDKDGNAVGFNDKVVPLRREDGAS